MEESKFYAGIGSRLTPQSVLEFMAGVSKVLESKGYILRSGGAGGADLAFENGVTDPKNKQIFVPFKGFNGSDSTLILDDMEHKDLAYATVDAYHPNPFALRRKGKKAVQLMARNSFQVLGPDHNSWSKFIICWTEGGKISGGTGQSLRIAKKLGIKVYNLGHDIGREELKEFLRTL